MDDGWLASALVQAGETERALWTFLVGGSDRPDEVTEAWRAYRHAAGLRKSLEQLRRVCQARNSTGAAEA